MVDFGSKAFVYIDKESRTKMQDHVWIGYFIGYPFNSKAFLVYDPARMSVFVCYHVLFDERVKYGDEFGERKREREQRQLDHDELARKDREELELATADSQLARSMREGTRRDLEVDMQDGVEHSVYRSASASIRAALQDEAMRDSASPQQQQQQHQQQQQQRTPLRTPIAASSPLLQRAGALPPRQLSTPQSSAIARALPSSAPTPSNEPSAVRRSRRPRMQRVQEGSYVDARHQLKHNKQWTHVACSTPPLSQHDRSTALGVTPSTLVLLSASMAAAADQIFCTKTAPDHYPMPPVLAALTTDDRSAASKLLDLQKAAAASWLQNGGYINPTNIFGAWSRDGREGQMFQGDSDHEVAYLVRECIATPVDRRTLTGANILTCHWVFNMKWDPVLMPDGETKWIPTRGRARWVPHGNKQVEGIDYDGHGVASPVARTESFFILFSLVAQFKLHTCLIDIAKAFFHGDIGDKKVFVKLPPGYRQGVYAEYGADTVWQLHKAVYGLKQSGYAYYQRIKTDMKANGYTPLKADCCVFLRIVKAPPGAPLSDFARTHDGYEIMIIALWVDDNKIAYSAPHMLDHFRKFLRKCGYDFRDYGEWKYSLGLDISYSRSEGRLLLSSKSYLSAFFKALPFKCTPPHLTPAPTGARLKREDCVKGSLSENKFWWSEHFRRCLGAMSHIQNWTFPELAVSLTKRENFLDANPVCCVCG
jgi:hypothetical protein